MKVTSMGYILEGLKQALILLITFDPEIYRIIGLSMMVSLTSITLAGIIGVPLGIFIALKKFKFKKVVTRILYTSMSLPPVVVGLVVAILLSRRGPLGSLNLMFTSKAMIIAQTLLITPIVMGIIFNHAKVYGEEIKNVCMTLGGKRLDMLILLIKEMRINILIALITGFGRAISEVGAVMLVGGNILGHTRVMTTFIAMNNSMGNYSTSIAMGIVLLLLSFVINSVLYHYVLGADHGN
jgi:tungstate transport system permease protein